LNGIQLGKNSEYKDQYDASLLEAIPRNESRSKLPVHDWAFSGKDIWNAYEVSWLNSKGVPRVAIAEFEFDASSPCIVESKSFKYYLNSYNQTKFDSETSVQRQMQIDLQVVSGADVKVALLPLTDTVLPISGLPARSHNGT
jgi:7-cyano-7-deazaguanine reductase